MFTAADICNIAVQIEKNGEATYRLVAGASRDPEIVAALNWMANQERQHAQWFESIRPTRQESVEQQEMEEMGRTLLQEMIKDNDFLITQDDLTRIVSAGEVLARSKALEEDTILFYRFLLDLFDDGEAIRLILRIIEEEENHIHELERLEKSAGKRISDVLS